MAAPAHRPARRDRVPLLVRCVGERFVLVVDAGHGGNDQGALGRRSLEKEVNLK